MLVSALYEAVNAVIPLPEEGVNERDRDRLAVILATCRALGVFYMEGRTTNAPVDTDEAADEAAADEASAAKSAAANATAARWEATPLPSVCKFCEREQCDGDCSFCDIHRSETGAPPRMTAAQHRAIGGMDALARMNVPVRAGLAPRSVHDGSVKAEIVGNNRLRIVVNGGRVGPKGVRTKEAMTIDAGARARLRNALNVMDGMVAIPRALYFAGDPVEASSSIIADMLTVGKYDEAIMTFLEFHWRRVLVLLGRAEIRARIANEYGLVLRDPRTQP